MLVRHGARVVSVVVALFVVGVLFLSAHVAALRRSLEAHVGGLRAAQAVQRALVSGGPTEERSRALSELRFALAQIPDRAPTVNTAAARLGVITTPGTSSAEQADALDGLVSALREASSAISHRLGATWTWLAAYAVAAILLAGLAWWLSRQIQRARLRAEELYASLQAETASRLAAQEQRQAYERLLDQVIEHAPVAIAIHGDDGRLLRRNPEHERLFGGARGPIEALDRARRGVATAGEEHVVQRPGVPALVVELAAAPVPGAGGVESVVLFARDVTEVRRRQQQAWAEDRATMVATMARGMGHELRNPLTFVLGNIDWLLDEVTHAEGLSEETRRTWEQALVDMADGAARLRGAASDLGALGGHGATGRCDPREAVRLAARLVPELGEVARVAVEPGRAPLVRGSLAHVALVISDVLRRVAALLGASGGDWLVRVGCEPDGDGARVQVTAEADAAREELSGPSLSPDAAERAFGATPSATVAPVSGLLSHLGATLEAVVVRGALSVHIGLGAPDAEAPAGDPAPSGSRT